MIDEDSPRLDCDGEEISPEALEDMREGAPLPKWRRTDETINRKLLQKVQKMIILID